jgi:glycosyltransferase involved in cell wall biosynthesis
MLVALGRMTEFKGLHVLARAADRILLPHPDAHVVIAGDGPMRTEIAGHVARAASRDRVHLTGAVSRDDAARLLADADLFLNPGVVDSTGHAEPLGITTMEAMASGLACVGSRVGGLTETISDGETGILVPHGDDEQLAGAIGRLLSDAPLRRSMGDAARRRARERFTWSVLAGETAKVYEEVRSA